MRKHPSHSQVPNPKMLQVMSLTHRVLRFTVTYKLTHSCTRPIHSYLGQVSTSPSMHWSFMTLEGGNTELSFCVDVSFFLFFLILYGFIDRTASEMTGNRTTDRGWYAAKGPRQGLKPRATAGNPLYQLSQQVQLCWFCLQDALTWVNPPQNSSYTLFQLNYLSDLDTYEPYLKTWFSR